MIFGFISVFTVASGYFIINRQHEPGTNQHLLCMHGYEWIYLTPVGNVFGTLHQLLVLMQINITQYVLVRIPRNMGLFNPEDKHDEDGFNKVEDAPTAINADGETEDGFKKC